MKIQEKLSDVLKFIKSKDFLQGFLVGLLVIAGTFPIDQTLSIKGVDGPLVWAFNYLFSEGMELGKNIVFPHGPLAFLMYPMSGNMFIAAIIGSLLKLLLCFNIARLLNCNEKLKWILTFILAVTISVLSEFNHLIIANVILSYTTYYDTKKTVHKLIAFGLTAFAFYIKSYVAIVTGTITFSFIIYYFLAERKFKTSIIDSLTIVGGLGLTWLIMYGSYTGFLRYFYGIFQLAQDNSAAAALHPDNNWWLLILFLLMVIMLPFIAITKKSVFYGSLMLLAHFAAWKHGMAREDATHMKSYLAFVIISLLIYLFYEKKHMFRSLIIGVLAIFLFVVNMKQSNNYPPLIYESFKINNFTDLLFDINSIKVKENKQINLEAEKYLLPDGIRKQIGNASVDIYPWNYFIIAINNLNWQPRPVIQSYAAYSSWLDKQNSQHFNSEKAPEFLIWELNKVVLDTINGGDMVSIDQRYLLNDEPQCMIQLLSSYKQVYFGENLIVFRKKTIKSKPVATLLITDKTQWNRWIDVPETINGILRAKFKYNRSFKQKFKSFLYKDEQFWIHLKLNNGIIHKYRIVPKNALDGLWVYPYISKPGNIEDALIVEKVLFKSSNVDIMNEGIEVEWELIKFENEPELAKQFFDPLPEGRDSLLLYSKNGFEQSPIDFWNELSNDKVLSGDAFQGEKLHLINAGAFSATFIYKLDNLPFDKLKILSECWVKCPDYNLTKDVYLVISVEDSTEENLMYEPLVIDKRVNDKMQWNHILNYVTYKHSLGNCILKIYIWNNSEQQIMVDDISISIFGVKSDQ